MESKIFHGESSFVERELNSFLKTSNIIIKNIEISTCKAGAPISPTMVTVLVLYERSK